MRMTQRKRVIQGGTSAGKTYAIIPILIDKATKTPKLKITVVAETIPAVKDGAVDIFKTVMFDTGRWRDSGWIGNPMEYTFANGSRIQFKAFDTEGKAKASGKRDILFLNEANHISYQIADALMIRSKETYIDFNPDNEFWAHNEVLKEPNSEFINLTYLDNEAAPKETIEDMLIKRDKAFFNPLLTLPQLLKETNIKSSYWFNWWKVYGLGMIGSLEGVIYSNWSQIDNIPEGSELLGYGLDWGFANDPCAMIAVYKYNGKFIIDELIYKTNLVNSSLINEMNAIKIDKSKTIVADSSEPKSIKDVTNAGYFCKGAYKGNDHKGYAIQKIQSFDEWHVTSRSINFIKELRAYMWAKDKEGNNTNKPEDGNDHGCDAFIYIANELFNLSNQNKAQSFRLPTKRDPYKQSLKGWI
jgi:phage terminase large subunit